MKRFLALILIAALTVGGLPVQSASAQQSSDDNENSERILVGMLIVVVSLLLILGVKEEIEKRREWAAAFDEGYVLDEEPGWFNSEGLVLEF